MLPIDDRLRAVARGQFSRLAQYEIEVENPLRPKEIQARIRAGETVEEIADAAGIPVDRVRWFEGPVLAERGYVAQQAQNASVRRQGDSTPGPRLGEVVAERLTELGADPEDAQWDSRKHGDGSWQVQLAFRAGGRLHIAEWLFDPRRLARDARRRQRGPAVAAGSRAAPAGRRIARGGHRDPDQAPGPPGGRTAASRRRGTGRGTGRGARAGRRARGVIAVVRARAPAGGRPPETRSPAAQAQARPRPPRPVRRHPVRRHPVRRHPVRRRPGPGTQLRTQPGITPRRGNRTARRPPARATRPLRPPPPPLPRNRPSLLRPAASARRPRRRREIRMPNGRLRETPARNEPPAPGTAPARTAPQTAPQAPPQPAAEKRADEVPVRGRGKKAAGPRGRRSSVPSWDEIMLGNSRQPE